ncbi:adenylate/guanylate cyclase domain-containing protein [Cypionkella aquatica]|uniref:Adenylate/guanylate cyclase domain-containing protein n=1 Tax=Cypionkella aquatica TaxID=1756042 RepID=A0AA37TRD2_9RHOB|nr:adenylate/guanylate cyclase domain-containing protein [Cypionkella aquatica]GLS86354.1 adenylate/guanylate cyclase domain-containing protein [Cypionkella aquatica]
MSDLSRVGDMHARPDGWRRLAQRLRSSASVLRLWSGLILFGFAALHLLNHALGLVSLEAMQAGQDLRLAVTRSTLGTLILCAAALVHFCLGMWRFIYLRTWRIGLRGVVQLLFGLLIPILLIRHVLGTRGVHEFFGIADRYAYALRAMWPGEAVRLALLVTLVWVHGCIGLHMWLSPRPWYRRNLWAVYGLAVLIPTLGYAGYVSAGRLERLRGGGSNPFTPEQYALIQSRLVEWPYAYFFILMTGMAIWFLLLVANQMGARVTVRYAYGPTITASRGMSVLEISQANRIPHASVCGGRARCSTCRVRVLEGFDQLPAPSATEQQVLRRVGAPANVRLGCQLRPTADVMISTLLPANLEQGRTGDFDKYHWGVEREVTLLFCDLRGFTKMSEGRLSFDVVFVLNQFLGRMAEAIEDSGGFVDKFMGDGIMAIFGMDAAPSDGARQAIAAARAMSGVLDSLNQSLHEELRIPLAMGIGIHSGPAILGRIGSVQRTESVARLTALGETVNIASRLESATKELGVQAAVSAYALKLSGLQPNETTIPRTVEIRGLSQPLDIVVARRATGLPQPG